MLRPAAASCPQVSPIRRSWAYPCTLSGRQWTASRRVLRSWVKSGCIQLRCWSLHPRCAKRRGCCSRWRCSSGNHRVSWRSSAVAAITEVRPTMARRDYRPVGSSGVQGTALLPDDDGGRLLWILASGLPREAGRQPHVATLHPIPPRTHFWGMGECKAAEPVFRKGVLPRGHMSFLPVALLALAWPGLTWYPWRMCLNLHFSYAVCLCNRLATNKPPGGANYNPHIAP